MTTWRHAYFILIFLCGPLAVDGTIVEAWVQHESRYQQASTQEPVPAFPGFAGRASLLLAAGSGIQSGFVRLPNGLFVEKSVSNRLLSFEEEAGSISRLNQRFPEGVYRFSLALPQGGFIEGEVGGSFGQIPADVPHVTNYPALQRIDPVQPFQVTWQPWEGPPGNGFIEVEIWRFRAFEDPVLVFRRGPATSPLDPAATSIELPAGLFLEEGSYALKLAFAQLAQTPAPTETPPPYPAYSVTAAANWIELGLTTDPELNPRLNWLTVHELAWPTTERHFLSPPLQPSPYTVANIAFAPNQFSSTPPAHIHLTGPENTPYASSVAIGEDLDPVFGEARYVIPPNGLGWPQPGLYEVSFRDRTYAFEQASPPSPETSTVVYPTVTLGDSGTIERIDWQYVSHATGQVLPPPVDFPILDVVIVGREGTAPILAFDLPSEQMQLQPTESAAWQDVERAIFTLRTDSGDSLTSVYSLTLYPSPLEIYFYDLNISGNWARVNWFDLLEGSSWPWCWSSDHGWIYAHGSGWNHPVFFDNGIGWWTTSPDTFPFIYHYASGRWFYYRAATRFPARMFYVFNPDGPGGQWIQEGDIGEVFNR